MRMMIALTFVVLAGCSGVNYSGPTNPNLHDDNRRNCEACERN